MSCQIDFYRFNQNQNYNMACRGNNNGFTLVEISIVVLVAAIAIGMAVPAYIYLVDNARTDKTIDEIKEMQRDINRYRKKNNRYPDSLNELFPQHPN
jgi:prepilin-type N-terminal cleavage/methylation domain-containing protein